MVDEQLTCFGTMNQSIINYCFIKTFNIFPFLSINKESNGCSLILD